MPINYSDYPSNWKDIRKDILERANHCCEWCGVKNYTYGYRNLDGEFVSEYTVGENIYDDAWWESQFGDDQEPKRIRIILTVAHLGIPKFPCDTGDKNDKMDCRYNNLVALCQKCHLNFDKKQHIENRQKTLQAKRDEAIEATGQLKLF